MGTSCGWHRRPVPETPVKGTHGQWVSEAGPGGRGDATRANRSPLGLSAARPRELVLDHIVERKRLDDLCRSIIDGRFREQKVPVREPRCSPCSLPARGASEGLLLQPLELWQGRPKSAPLGPPRPPAGVQGLCAGPRTVLKTLRACGPCAPGGRGSSLQEWDHGFGSACWLRGWPCNQAACRPGVARAFHTRRTAQAKGRGRSEAGGLARRTRRWIGGTGVRDSFEGDMMDTRHMAIQA